MVTKDKQWCTFNVLRLSTTYNGYKISKYASNFKFPITPTRALHMPYTHLMHTLRMPYMRLCAACKFMIGLGSPPQPITALRVLRTPSRSLWMVKGPHHNQSQPYVHLCAPSRSLWMVKGPHHSQSQPYACLCMPYAHHMCTYACLCTPYVHLCMPMCAIHAPYVCLCTPYARLTCTYACLRAPYSCLRTPYAWLASLWLVKGPHHSQITDI